MNKATMMECYHKWMNKEEGYTRATMTRKQYGQMMRAFSEAGLKRRNFRVSTNNYTTEEEYRKARAEYLREWRRTAFRRLQSEGVHLQPETL